MNNGPKELAHYLLSPETAKFGLAPTNMADAVGLRGKCDLYELIKKEANFSLEGAKKGFSQEMPQDVGKAPKGCDDAANLLDSLTNPDPDKSYQSGVSPS